MGPCGGGDPGWPSARQTSVDDVRAAGPAAALPLTAGSRHTDGVRVGPAPGRHSSSTVDPVGARSATGSAPPCRAR